MATKKKTPVKKVTAKKAPVKKTSAKKAPVHRAAAATSSRSTFMQTKFTEQTIYWLIIGVVVIALAAWVLSIQVQLNDMYDQIDASAASDYVPSRQNL